MKWSLQVLASSMAYAIGTLIAMRCSTSDETLAFTLSLFSFHFFPPNNLHPLKLYLYYYIVIVFYNVNLWRANLLFFFLLSLWKKKKKCAFWEKLCNGNPLLDFFGPLKWRNKGIWSLQREPTCWSQSSIGKILHLSRWVMHMFIPASVVQSTRTKTLIDRLFIMVLEQSIN